MQFFRNFVANQSWARPDVLKDLYPDFDWDRSVIGGSYALNILTGDCSWTPNDVDILIAADSVEDFQARVQAFVACDPTKRQVEKFSDFSKGHPNDDPEALRRDEKFHEAIRASAKVRASGIDQVLQFVYIDANPPTVTGLRAVLDEITDIPACVNYQVLYGRKQFYVPEKGLAALFTKKVKQSDVCPARLAKYQERGYTFMQ